jgi:probable phosphoglycerate mutase
MAESLAGEHFDEVLVSPLLRARQTAEPLLQALGHNETLAPWLQEIGNPDWHGSPAGHVQEAYKELMARPSLEHWTGLEGGENVRHFADRILAGADQFLQERGAVRLAGDLPVWKVAQRDMRVACVAHAGTNSMVIGHLLGVEPVPWQWERFQLFHTSVTRLETFELGDGHAFGLARLGSADHLEPEDRTR